MVAWELTRNCNLACIHCRASAANGPHEGELSTAECRRIIDDIVGFSAPTVILTGGEPLMRPDLFDIIEYGQEKGLRMVIAVNGTLLDESTAGRLKAAGIKRVSLSVDGKDRQSHDSFRGVEGSFDAVTKAAGTLRKTGLSFQFNTTVTALNVNEIDEYIPSHGSSGPTPGIFSFSFRWEGGGNSRERNCQRVIMRMSCIICARSKRGMSSK
jgi:MoaA/NifB/PqqE/SkfB family radical SAM enzyme